MAGLLSGAGSRTGRLLGLGALFTLLPVAAKAQFFSFCKDGRVNELEWSIEAH